MWEEEGGKEKKKGGANQGGGRKGGGGGKRGGRVSVQVYRPLFPRGTRFPGRCLGKNGKKKEGKEKEGTHSKKKRRGGEKGGGGYGQVPTLFTFMSFLSYSFSVLPRGGRGGRERKRRDKDLRGEGGKMGEKERKGGAQRVGGVRSLFWCCQPEPSGKERGRKTCPEGGEERGGGGKGSLSGTRFTSMSWLQQYLHLKLERKKKKGGGGGKKEV